MRGRASGGGARAPSMVPAPPGTRQLRCGRRGRARTRAYCMKRSFTSTFGSPSAGGVPGSVPCLNGYETPRAPSGTGLPVSGSIFTSTMPSGATNSGCSRVASADFMYSSQIGSAAWPPVS